VARVFGLVIFLLLAISVAGVQLSAPRPIFPDTGAASLDEGGDVENGRRIFAAADCASCHASPGQHDRLRLGGGLAVASPFGTLRVPNISPDVRDGIGGWRPADLANALLSGVSPQREHYYPALPYTSYTHMRLEDVRDLMAYLRTLPPVTGRPPPHHLPFPFDIRRLVGFWKLFFFHPGPLPADRTHDAAWNRGRYLVEAVSHCAECHSSRNVWGAVKARTRYAGGQDPEGVGFAPDITPLGTDHWTRDQWVEFLSTGRTPDLRFVGSSMAAVLANTATLPQNDRVAMATYLLSLRARPAALP
jgi:mono/diheme cytochrome c family protein